MPLAVASVTPSLHSMEGKHRALAVTLLASLPPSLSLVKLAMLARNKASSLDRKAWAPLPAHASHHSYASAIAQLALLTQWRTTRYARSKVVASFKLSCYLYVKMLSLAKGKYNGQQARRPFGPRSFLPKPLRTNKALDQVKIAYKHPNYLTNRLTQRPTKAHLIVIRGTKADARRTWSTALSL